MKAKAIALFALLGAVGCQTRHPTLDRTIERDGRAALGIIDAHSGDVVTFAAPRFDLIGGNAVTQIVFDSTWHLLSDDVYLDLVGAR